MTQDEKRQGDKEKGREGRKDKGAGETRGKYELAFPLSPHSSDPLISRKYL
jgi:hypothetical protein